MERGRLHPLSLAETALRIAVSPQLRMLPGLASFGTMLWAIPIRTDPLLGHQLPASGRSLRIQCLKY